MVAVASPKDTDDLLSIISADENRTMVTNAMKADYNALQQEAEQQVKRATTDGQRESWTILSGLEDFDTDGIQQPLEKAWYYRPHIVKWIWWDLWAREVSNEGAVRETWIDRTGEQIAREEPREVRMAEWFEQKAETETRGLVEVTREVVKEEAVGEAVKEEDVEVKKEERPAKRPKLMKPGTEKAVKREAGNDRDVKTRVVKTENRPAHGHNLRSMTKSGAGKAMKREDDGVVKAEKREDLFFRKLVDIPEAFIAPGTRK